MTTNDITADQIIDSWAPSAHMSSAIEYLYAANHTPYIVTQINNIEASIEHINKGKDKLKNKQQVDAANSAIKFLRKEISRLRKKLQRGSSTEERIRTVAAPAHEKEIKRIDKAVKKEKKEAKKAAKKATSTQNNVDTAAPTSDKEATVRSKVKGNAAATNPVVMHAQSKLKMDEALLGVSLSKKSKTAQVVKADKDASKKTSKKSKKTKK